MVALVPLRFQPQPFNGRSYLVKEHWCFYLCQNRLIKPRTIVINDASPYSKNSPFSIRISLNSSTKISINSLLFFEQYANKSSLQFPDIAIFTTLNCQNILLAMTYLDFQIHVSTELQAEILLPSSKSTFFFW